MGRMSLCIFASLAVLLQCGKYERPAAGDTDRAALLRVRETIDNGAEPTYSVFAAAIGELRSRFGDTPADALANELLERFPAYGPAHLVLAQSFFRHGQHEAAIREARLARACVSADSPAEELRAISRVLDAASMLAGKGRFHGDWTRQ